MCESAENRIKVSGLGAMMISNTSVWTFSFFVFVFCASKSAVNVEIEL